MDALQYYFENQYIGHADKLRDRFYATCDSYVCYNALKTILDMLSGQGNCDLLQMSYDGQFVNQPYNYQGWRDQVSRHAAFVVDMALVALSIEVGNMVMPQDTMRPWINIQSNYLRPIEMSINRIMQFDQQAKDQALWNAERNLNLFIKTNITAAMNTSTISDSVQSFLTTLAPSHRWLVLTYESINSAKDNSWRCQFCFVAQDVAQAYSILVIGASFSWTGNTTLLAQFSHENVVDEYDTANAMVEGNYADEPCLGGVISSFGGKYLYSWSSNAAGFDGLQQVFGATRYRGYGAFWAFNGDTSVMCRQV